MITENSCRYNISHTFLSMCAAVCKNKISVFLIPRSYCSSKKTIFHSSYCYHVYVNREEELISTINVAEKLMKLFLSELLISDHQLNIIKTSITLLLYGLCQMEAVVCQGSEVSKTFQKCEIALYNWIKRDGVVGGSFFGRRAEDEMKLVSGLTELKVNTLHTVTVTLNFLVYCLLLIVVMWKDVRYMRRTGTAGCRC